MDGTGMLRRGEPPRCALGSSPESDRALVGRTRAGDDRAFEELFRRHRRQVMRCAYRVLRDTGRAEDVAQETFISALMSLRSSDAEIDFKPWIARIARNAAIDAYRRLARAKDVPLAEAALHPADRRRLVCAEGPHAAVVGKERLDGLTGALASLPERQNRIVVLRELEGCSYREIGARMSLTGPAVESTLFRARRRLKEAWAQREEAEAVPATA